MEDLDLFVYYDLNGDFTAEYEDVVLPQKVGQLVITERKLETS